MKFWQHYKYRIIGSLVIAGALGAATVFWLQQKSTSPIVTFQQDRDLDFILSQFDKYWFWLVAEERDQYDPKFHIVNRSRTKNPRDFGTLQIKVYRADDEPAGFVAYYKKNMFEGIILYVSVDEKYRGRGYGDKLVDHAIQDLFAQGCTVISLVTRIINKHARALYERHGFVVVAQDDPFVYYKKIKTA